MKGKGGSMGLQPGLVTALGVASTALLFAPLLEYPVRHTNTVRDHPAHTNTRGGRLSAWGMSTYCCTGGWHKGPPHDQCTMSWLSTHAYSTLVRPYKH